MRMSVACLQDLDPYLGGTHLPDITLIAPIFIQHQGEAHLIGFAANRAHHADVGGMSPGSRSLPGRNTSPRYYTDRANFYPASGRSAFDWICGESCPSCGCRWHVSRF